METFIIICITLNIITMGMTYEGKSEEYDLNLRIVNYVFTSVFILECILKIIAYGLKDYLNNTWNQFDFFVVSTSLVDLALDMTGNSVSSFLKVGP